MKSNKPLAVLALGIALLGAHPAAAQSIYTAGHGDFDPIYTPGSTTFDVVWGIDAGAVVDGTPLSSHVDYEPDELVAYAPASSLTRSDQESWLGVPAGSTVYRMGSDATPPNFGFNSSGAGAETDWQDSLLHISLIDWSGPGDIGLSFGSDPTYFTYAVYFSTFDPDVTKNDNVWNFNMQSGHIHLNWYFTEPGYYEITFNWTGTYIGGDSPIDVSGTGTFGIYAGVNPIPEPATWTLLSLSILPLGLAILCKRKHRKCHLL